MFLKILVTKMLELVQFLMTIEQKTLFVFTSSLH